MGRLFISLVHVQWLWTHASQPLYNLFCVTRMVCCQKGLERESRNPKIKKEILSSSDHVPSWIARVTTLIPLAVTWITLTQLHQFCSDPKPSTYYHQKYLSITALKGGGCWRDVVQLYQLLWGYIFFVPFSLFSMLDMYGSSSVAFDDQAKKEFIWFICGDCKMVQWKHS